MVDTSASPLAPCRYSPPGLPEIDELGRAPDEGESIVTAGIVVQECCRVSPSRRRARRSSPTSRRFLCSIPRGRATSTPPRSGTRAAEVRGQLEMIDALIAQLCIAHGLTLQTTDRDFDRVARDDVAEGVARNAVTRTNPALTNTAPIWSARRTARIPSSLRAALRERAAAIRTAREL